MEQHPVPQNVTTFQFRLIGDMTIKQFGYLAAGAIGGYICYKLPLPFFFTWPLAILSVVLGIGLAFVPIEERPMDVWLLSFIKSIYSPTQYLWQKTKPVEPQAATPKATIPAPPPPTQPVMTAPQATAVAKPVSAPTAQQFAPVVPTAVPTKHPSPSITQTLEHLFQSAGKPTPKAHPVPPHVDMAMPARGPSVVLTQQAAWDPFGFLKDMFHPKPRPARAIPQASTVMPPPAPARAGPAYPDIFAQTGPLPSLTGKKLDLTQPAPQAGAPTPEKAATLAMEQAAEKKEKELTEKLEKMQTELASSTGQTTMTNARILELQKQLTDVLAERNQMERELAGLRNKLTQTTQAPQVTRPAGVVAAPQVAQPTVRVITPETAVKAGLPRLTTFPNVVTGIIKDAEGNLLPGVLVTVRDKDEVPVRALKTNKLGQYAASTPLPSGTYTVDIEDPRGQHFFDRVRVALNGTVMPPVEVTSKSKKQMDRTKLAQEIFGVKEL